MKRTVSESDFMQAFDDYGRGDSFSGSALDALFNYLVDLEDDMGEELELDVVAIDCEWAEYASALDAAKDYGYEEDNQTYYLESMDTIEMSIDEARSASHSGPCDKDVLALSKLPHVQMQLEDLDADDVREELGEIGGWGEDELNDDEENLQRILWIAAGFIVDDYDPEDAEDLALEWLRERTAVIEANGSVVVQGF